MLQKFITSIVAAVVIGSVGLPASAAQDSDVVTSLLATLYAPGSSVEQDEAARSFYAAHDYLPVWWHDGVWSADAHAAVEALGRADAYGLSPARYGSSLLGGAIDQGFAAAAGPDAVAATELALTNALLAYVGERDGGIVDPASVGWMSRRSSAPDTVALLGEALASGNVSAWLDRLAPPRTGYVALTLELAHYRALSLLPWHPISDGDSIKPGASDPRLPDLRERLVLLGDLPALPEASLLDVDSFIYDDATIAAVQSFQLRHGLEPDGVVGRRTLAQLNTSPAERARTIVANLEKLRWMPGTDALGDHHIEVNIAGYELVAYDGDKPVLVMPVIVGESDHPTPVFSDRIVNLKFAPNWTVPFKIAKTELLPKIQHDPSWLITNNYKVISDWGRDVEIDPWSVDWSTVTPATWSYMLQQQPGPSSALGLIRFSLTNPQDIYLHDTGSRNLFSRAGRSLSHGCVRVGDPTALAEYVLRGDRQSWTRERILTAMNAEQTDVHRLDTPVPVDFFYITAWVDGSGHMQFRRDIYGTDARVLAALDAAAAVPVIDLPMLVGSTPETGDGEVKVTELGGAQLPL